jgi:type I site-specific restriction-modification system R (restriction) subunit
MTANIAKSTVEDAALSWFRELGYGVLHGPDIVPDEAGAERGGFDDVILVERLQDAIDRINPDIPAEAREEAFHMGTDELKVIATELVLKVRENVSIVWTIRESARARIRVLVRHILRKHGYPPDLHEEATRMVLEQAEALCADWAA